LGKDYDCWINDFEINQQLELFSDVKETTVEKRTTLLKT